jgi:hypothetical protein
MLRTFRRYAPVAALSAVMLAGCGDDPATSIPTAAPTMAVEQPASQQPTSSVVGFLKSADTNQVVIDLPDGSGRTFLVRPEDAPRLGIRHLASHAGLTDIGFRITYVTADGKDYVVAAEETAPPQ